MFFSERLAAERKRLGYRQPEFATACGVATQTQSLYETGKRSPDADYLQAACKLGADPAFLLTGTPMAPDENRSQFQAQEPMREFAAMPAEVRDAVISLVKAVKRGDHNG